MVVRNEPSRSHSHSQTEDDYEHKHDDRYYEDRSGPHHSDERNDFDGEITTDSDPEETIPMFVEIAFKPPRDTWCGRVLDDLYDTCDRFCGADDLKTQSERDDKATGRDRDARYYRHPNSYEDSDELTERDYDLTPNPTPGERLTI